MDTFDSAAKLKGSEEQNPAASIHTETKGRALEYRMAAAISPPKPWERANGARKHPDEFLEDLGV